MKSFFNSKSWIIGSAILFIGAAVAFAHGGGMGHDGNGIHMGGGYGMGPGMIGNGYSDADGYGMGPGRMGYGSDESARGYSNDAHLSNAQQSRIEASQENFYRQTQDLRNKIQDRRDALQDELNSDHPDADRVKEIQKDLSGLQARYNQKWVQHQLEIRTIANNDDNPQ